MKKVLYTFLTSAFLVGTASAQMANLPPGGPHGHEFGPAGFGRGMHGKVVTGAPYTATATDTFTQTLANGTTIQRTTTATVARDSAGRTYEQQTINAGPLAANGPVTVTFITDPVAGYAYVLNPNTKTAIRRALHTPSNSSSASSTSTSAATTRSQHAANANVVQADLGTQVMNGVNVTGKHSTHTIPAGTMGNSQAIVSTGEVWTSPDLHVVVSATRTDPRTGTSVYALTNIQQQEPAATLFQVPSDYTIQDAKQGRGNWTPNRQ